MTFRDWWESFTPPPPARRLRGTFNDEHEIVIGLEGETLFYLTIPRRIFQGCHARLDVAEALVASEIAAWREGVELEKAKA